MAKNHGRGRHIATLAIGLATTFALGGCDKLRGLTGGEAETEAAEAAPEEPPEELPEEPAQDAASFTGTWKTAWGPVTMVQKGSDISGSYTGRFTGSLQGEVKGKTAEVTWKQTNGERGKARFTIGEDGKSFRGTWGSLSSATNGGPWNGTRQR